MKPPLSVRALAAEQAAVQRGLRSADAFTLRRCQILAASAKGQRPSPIAAALGCASQTVRDAIRACHAGGTAGLQAKPKMPKTIHTAWPRQRDADLRALRHPSPRGCGKPTSLWTLGLAAEVCHEHGWTPRRLSGETIRLARKRPGVACASGCAAGSGRTTAARAAMCS